MTASEGHFVTLSQALNWIAFGNWSNSDCLWASHDDGKYRLELALQKFCDAACAGQIEIRAKLVPDHVAKPENYDTSVIAPEKFHDFCRYDPMHCGLRVGKGLFGFPDESEEGLTYVYQPTAREEFYRDVLVCKDKITSVLKPSASRVKTTSKADKDCTDWLEQEFALDPDHRLPKTVFRSKALANIEGLSGRGFDRAWSSVAPSAGRSASGRKKSAH